MPTGTATCPHCQLYLDQPALYMTNRYPVTTAKVSGELITDLPTLLRLRDESNDQQVEINDGVFVTRPKLQVVDLGNGTTMRMPDPATLRRAIRHVCPVHGGEVVLYDDGGAA